MSRTFFHRLTPFFKLILVSILLLNFMLLNFSCTKDETADNNSPKETAAQETAASNVDKEDDTMNEEIVSLDNSWPDLPRGSWLTDNSDEGLTLIGDGVECEIVVRKEENSAVHQAAKFLAKDIEKITGICPRIVSHATKGKVTIRLATLDTTEIPDEIDKEKLEGQWEAYQILTLEKDLWLVGSNFRGTAFACYTLCEHLGIDPLYLWTGYEPEQRDTLIIKNINHFQKPPTFKFRGTFHDDEDILPRPLDHREWPDVNGKVPLEWYKKYFETALRLRMNIVAPYTRTQRRYDVQKTASDWGLFYTSHHYDILLSNPYGMYRHKLAEKRGVTGDWDWLKNRENMLRYWRAGVEENKKLECIWPLGLRGTEDLDYFFPDDMSDEDKDRIYMEVIEEQMKIVKELLPEGKEAYFHLNLYGGMLECYERGNIKLPEEVMLVWPDNVLGKMKALPGPNEPHKNNGVYYHLAFCPSTLQMTHQVQPWRVCDEFTKIVDSNSTQYMLVNVSEMRDYVKELYLIARICYDAESTLSLEKPQDHFIKWFAIEYFGEEAAPYVVEAYSHYDTLMESHGGLRIASDIIYNKQYPELKKKFKGEEYQTTPTEDLNKLQSRAKQYDEAVDLIDKAFSNMTTKQRLFFGDQMLGIKIDYWQTKAALIIEEALSEPDLDKAWKLVEKSLEPLEQLELDILRSEYYPFENWYRESWARSTTSPFNLHRSYRLIKTFIVTNGKEDLAEPKNIPVK